MKNRNRCEAILLIETASEEAFVRYNKETFTFSKKSKEQTEEAYKEKLL